MIYHSGRLQALRMTKLQYMMKWDVWELDLRKKNIKRKDKKVSIMRGGIYGR